MTHPDVFLLATIATAHGVRARLVTDDWSQIADDTELARLRDWLAGMQEYPDSLYIPRRAEFVERVGDLTDAAYGQLDLGTRCVVSGGEIMELGTQEGNDTEIPF